MDQGLQRVLNLAKKTGDNVIVFDSLNPEQSYVILAINKYEDLLEEAGYRDFLTEEQMTDKINRDIEPWSLNNQDWNLEDISPNDFLPKNLFGEESEREEMSSLTEATEDEWEEDINYLYPTEDEFASLETGLETDNHSITDSQANPDFPTEDSREEIISDQSAIESKNNQETSDQFKPDFSSIGELLEDKKNKSNVWEIPEKRQV